MDSRLPPSRDGHPIPERTPVSRSAAERLRRIIEDGHLKPGDRLPPQRELADHLRVSRASLREALSALETLGLVSVQPGRGVYVCVRPPAAQGWRFSDRGSPRDAYEVRYCVESFAASIAAVRLDEPALRVLRESVEALEAAYARLDLEAMALADSTFHDVIIDACGNAVLTAMYRSVREMLVESQRLPMTASSGLEMTVEEHKALLSALIRRDPVQAADLMRGHIRAAAARFGITLTVQG